MTIEPQRSKGDSVMTKKELAAQLNGRKYGDEITPEEARKAKCDGLLVVYGSSDDLCELEGAISEELSVYEGGEFFIHPDGKLLQQPDDDEAKVLKKFNMLTVFNQQRDKCAKVEIKWDSDGYSWTYDTALPHATFDIMDDGNKYCRGIVIDLKEL